MNAAILDYGLGNLFSIGQSCRRAGLAAELVDTANRLQRADMLILPGVGAFGDAMAALSRLDLISPIRDYVATGRPVIGICLGMQLMMSESHEFGRHAGLDLIPGTVELLEPGFLPSGRRYKVPNIGWNQIFLPGDGSSWGGSPLCELADGEFQYFVHSFAVRPAEEAHILSLSRYGDMEYCSSIQKGNLFACQFHPERSGMAGQKIYDTLVKWVGDSGGG